jgi:hypothetical protein
VVTRREAGRNPALADLLVERQRLLNGHLNGWLFRCSCKATSPGKAGGPSRRYDHWYSVPPVTQGGCEFAERLQLVIASDQARAGDAGRTSRSHTPSVVRRQPLRRRISSATVLAAEDRGMGDPYQLYREKRGSRVR